MSKKSYDVAIIGGGLSGLSTAYFLSLFGKKVVVYEKQPQYNDDKHWCFWLHKNEEMEFSHLISKTWSSWQVISPVGEKVTCKHEGLLYCCIKSNDFYNFMLNLKQFDVKFSQEISTLNSVQDIASIVIDARLANNNKYSYFQQFKGWLIETRKPSFNPGLLTIMDFSIGKDSNQIMFNYMLPFSEKIALIEPTIFTGSLQEAERFDQAFEHFIIRQDIQDYDIIKHEAGIIPMTEDYKSHDSSRIGTSAGWVRPSTGYSFKRTIKLAGKLASYIYSHNCLPETPFQPYSNISLFLDRIFLNFLKKNPNLAPQQFFDWFKNTPPRQMVNFLQDEANLYEIVHLIFNTSNKKEFFKCSLNI